MTNEQNNRMTNDKMGGHPFREWG